MLTLPPQLAPRSGAGHERIPRSAEEDMCKLCEGWTYDQLLARQVENIETYGFTLLSVTGPVPWTYSIGLRWRLDMPELVVVGWPAQAAGSVIHGVVDEVRKGSHDVRCGSVLQVGGSPVGLGWVAPDNAAGEWFAQWHRVARACGHGHRSLRALQLQPQCGAHCGEPHALLDGALAHRTTPHQLERKRRNHLDADQPEPEDPG